MSYILSCCSTADMPKEFFDNRNIPFIPFTYSIDGKEYPDDLGQTMSFGEFYKRIEKGAMPVTSQVVPGEFIEFFEPFLKEEKDILHISFSSGLSGTYDSACISRDELLSKYPNRKIIIIDSLAASSGYGMLVDLAADLRDGGSTIDEVCAIIEKNKLKLHHWFFSTDLTHYKRGGRISGPSAAIGTLLNICPLMNVNKEGKLIVRMKVRGKNHAINEIIKKMEQNAEKGIDYSGKCFISNSAALEDALRTAKLIEEKFQKLKGKVVINSIGTVIGAHTGPGTVALYFFGENNRD